MKREKGRTLGTAYGERGHQAARATRSTGNTNKAFGSGMMVMGGAAAAAGDLAGGAALVAAGYVERRLGGVQTDRASKQAAHATAVEGLVAKGRGGSAALGQKGVVPKAAGQRSGQKNLEGAKYMTGGLGDVHPSVARDYGAADNAMMLSRATRSGPDGPALAAAFRAKKTGKRADAGTAFKTADSHFHDTHMTGNQGAPASSDQQPHKGWSNAARIGAAKARGAKLPYGGDGTT